jgi:hypothetical protein
VTRLPGLDRRSRILRDRLHRAIHALDAYERLLLSGAMGGPDAPAKKAHALGLISRCIRDITALTKEPTG